MDITDNITDEQYDEAMSTVLHYERELHNFNVGILREYAVPESDFADCVEDCNVDDKISVVDSRVANQ